MADLKGTIRQRNPGSFELQVYLGRDSHGRRLRHTETVRGRKSDAQRRMREILAELDKGVAPPNQTYTLEQWLSKWMTDVIIPNRRRKTADRYSGMIRLHIVPVLGNHEIAKIRPVHVQNLETRLLDKGMSPKGVQMAHHLLNGAMRHALHMELILRNPVPAVTPPTVRKSEADTPDVDAVRGLLDIAENNGHELWPAIHLVAYTGLRRGEVLALQWDHVDFEDQRLRVVASLVITARGLSLEKPKTVSGERVVDLDTKTVEVLRGHRERQLAKARSLGVEPSGIVFPRKMGGWCHPGHLSKVLSTFALKAGSPNITLRSLRHFHASVALQTGQNIVVISKRLGHSNVSITSDIYAHSLPGWQREAADAFAAVMTAVG